MTSIFNRKDFKPLAKKHLLISWFSLIIVLFSSGVAAAKLEFESVTVKMSGETRDGAISRAIIEGVGRVNGKTVSAYQEVSSKLESRAGRTGTSENFLANVAQATYGVVNSYDVISVIKGKDGRWLAEIKMQVAKLSKDDGRLRLSLFNVTSGIWAKEADTLIAGLSSALVSSRKFDVIEAERMVQADALRDKMVSNPLVNEADRVQGFYGLGADMYVAIDLQDLEYSLKEISLPNFKPMRLPVGFVTVSIRVIDLFSSKVKFSDLVTVNLNASSFSGYSQKQLDSQLQKILAKVVGKRISVKILDAIYPMLIVDVSDEGIASINYGSDFLSPGDRYEIYERGRVVRDPYTKEAIGWDEKKIGILEIVHSNPKISFGTVKEGLQVINDGFAQKRYVLSKPQKNNAGPRSRERDESRLKNISDKF